MVKEGPEIYCRDFNVVKLSQASEASQYWLGSRAHLRALCERKIIFMLSKARLEN